MKRKSKMSSENGTEWTVKLFYKYLHRFSYSSYIY